MERGLGPDFVERGARVGVGDVVVVAKGELVGRGGVADEMCGEAVGAELIEDGVGIFGVNLNDGTEFLGEEGCER